MAKGRKYAEKAALGFVMANPVAVLAFIAIMGIALLFMGAIYLPTLIGLVNPLSNPFIWIAGLIAAYFSALKKFIIPLSFIIGGFFWLIEVYLFQGTNYLYNIPILGQILGALNAANMAILFGVYVLGAFTVLFIISFVRLQLAGGKQ